MEEQKQPIQNCIAKLGEQVRAFRKAKKWTQAQLAEQSHLSSVFIGRLERAEDGISLSNLIQPFTTHGYGFWGRMCLSYRYGIGGGVTTSAATV